MKHLKITLDSKSINDAIRELEDYKQSLRDKNRTFIERLLDEGISVARRTLDEGNSVARDNSGGYGKLISFSKEVKDGTRTIGLLVAEDKQKIIAEWDYYGNKKTAELSPLLLSEFGSATLSEVLFNISGVGQGTFPGQTHASEPFWRYKEWKDDNSGEWKVGRGVKPTHPMYKADLEMLQKIETIAREVFNGF